MRNGEIHPEGRRRILVVDDDRDLRTVVSQVLELEGFETLGAGSADEALAVVRAEGLPHLAILDVHMPGRTGFDLCRELQSFADLPVIFLTVVDDEGTIVETLRELAEDYLTKPFRPAELAARVDRVLRRFGTIPASGPRLAIDDRLAIAFAEQTAWLDGVPVALTPTETKLLHLLVRGGPRTVTSSYIISRVWPHEDVYEDTLRVHVYRLRQKIEPDPGNPRYVVTDRGLGYRFFPVA